MSNRTPEHLRAAHEKWQAIAAQRRHARFDDFMDLVTMGTSVEEAAKRIGTNPVALARQAYRWHRVDIVRYLSSATYRQRYGK